MSNLIDHAKAEFLAAGYIPLEQEQEEGPNKWMQQNVLNLLEIFAAQGHSGMSASFCIGMFKTLANYEPLCALTGEDSEWNDVSLYGSPSYQNKRCSHVFKDDNGVAYDINGKVFRTPDGSSYTSQNSKVYITFPYTPKTEYVDVAE